MVWPTSCALRMASGHVSSKFAIDVLGIRGIRCTGHSGHKVSFLLIGAAYSVVERDTLGLGEGSLVAFPFQQ